MNHPDQGPPLPCMEYCAAPSHPQPGDNNNNNNNKQVSEIEVFLLLESLDTNKSFGIDKIHPLLLKTAALQIYRPLTFIFNLSINNNNNNNN